MAAVINKLVNFVPVMTAIEDRSVLPTSRHTSPTKTGTTGITICSTSTTHATASILMLVIHRLPVNATFLPRLTTGNCSIDNSSKFMWQSTAARSVLEISNS